MVVEVKQQVLQVEKTFFFPNELYSSLIGKNGKNIKNLSKNLNIYVRLLPRKNTVRVNGIQESVEAFKEHLLQVYGIANDFVANEPNQPFPTLEKDLQEKLTPPTQENEEVKSQDVPVEDEDSQDVPVEDEDSQDVPVEDEESHSQGNDGWGHLTWYLSPDGIYNIPMAFQVGERSQYFWYQTREWDDVVDIAQGGGNLQPNEIEAIFKYMGGSECTTHVEGDAEGNEVKEYECVENEVWYDCVENEVKEYECVENEVWYDCVENEVKEYECVENEVWYDCVENEVWYDCVENGVKEYEGVEDEVKEYEGVENGCVNESEGKDSEVVENASVDSHQSDHEMSSYFTWRTLVGCFSLALVISIVFLFIGFIPIVNWYEMGQCQTEDLTHPFQHLAFWKYGKDRGLEDFMKNQMPIIPDCHLSYPWLKNLTDIWNTFMTSFDTHIKSTASQDA